MVWAAGLQFWDPENLQTDLLEDVGVQGMAGEDIEEALESLAGEQEASHHSQWWGQVWLPEHLCSWQEEEGLLDGNFQAPWGNEEIDTPASEVTGPEEQHHFYSLQVVLVVPVWETESTEGTVDTGARTEMEGAELQVLLDFQCQRLLQKLRAAVDVVAKVPLFLRQGQECVLEEWAQEALGIEETLGTGDNDTGY